MKKIKLAIVGGLLAGALTIPAISAKADDHRDFRVPPGHLPPPGKCRIWYPGTPPGRQPPPGDCRILSRQLPTGAWYDPVDPEEAMPLCAHGNPNTVSTPLATRVSTMASPVVFSLMVMHSSGQPGPITCEE